MTDPKYVSWLRGEYPWDLAPCGACIVLHGKELGSIYCQNPEHQELCDKVAALRKDARLFDFIRDKKDELTALRKEYDEYWSREEVTV